MRLGQHDLHTGRRPVFNLPILGYALVRIDFDSGVFPSEGGAGTVTTLRRR